MSKELYKRFRPTSFKTMFGQDKAISQVSKYLKDGNQLPHTLLITGPTGTGKTTLARILAKKIGCAPQDLNELNTADFRGVDSAREIRSKIGLSPMAGKCRVWIMDECHQLTKTAQEAFLKMWEDTPDHVWFFLCTTDPQKLISTVRNRCQVIKLMPVGSEALEQLIQFICKKIKLELSPEVVEKIIEASDESARKAMVILEAVSMHEIEEDQLQAIQGADAHSEAIQICRCLINPRNSWKDMAALLKNVNEEPETIRRIVLGYFSSVLLGGGKMAERAHFIILNFSENYYDTGKAGLIASCWESFQK